MRSWLADRDRLRGFLRLAATSADPDLRLGIAALDHSIAAGVGTLLAGAGPASDPETTAKRSEEAFRIVLSSLREAVLLRPRIAPSSREARDLVLLLTRSFFRGAGLEPVPGSYEELLGACGRGPAPWAG